MKSTILLIDDCDMMRRFLTPIFKDDYHVVAVSNAMDAIEWLQSNAKPTVILLDFQLPDLTGIQMLQWLKKNEGWKEIPVLMLSGVKDMERRWQCIEAGASDFLAKPFHPKELALRVNMISKCVHPAEQAAA